MLTYGMEENACLILSYEYPCGMISMRDRELPDNPLEFIRHCVVQNEILWTYHVNMRLRSRFIPREAILKSVFHYQIIEEYPADKYLPSYLVYSEYQGIEFHILFAVDLERGNVRIITSYRPNPLEWEPDLKKRRQL